MPYEVALKRFLLLLLALFLVAAGWQGVLGSAIAAFLTPQDLSEQDQFGQ